jgi:transcriptional regulator with XRE-family HTH domain
MVRWPANDRSGSWRSSARDAPGVGRALSQLGHQIRALRLERNLTQQRAARTAKLDEKHWQEIEAARTNPTVATLVGIARALKVTLAQLFGGKGTPERSPAPASARKARPRRKRSDDR